MKTIYLVVTLFINGVPTPGDTVDGWHRLSMPDMATCLRAANRGNNRPPVVGDINDIMFTCEEA